MADEGLSNEDKISIIQSHIKNIEYNKFNAELNLIEENATDTPDASAVATANATIARTTAQLAALHEEIAALQA